MKVKKFLIYVFLISLCSCLHKKPIFRDFDEVTYFHLKSDKLIDYQKLSDTTALKIVQDEFPSTLENYEFKNGLEEDRFKKINFNQNDVQILKEVFTDKYGISFTQNACAPIFRDILIFKQKKNIVGIAKLCLECEKHYFVGYNYNINVNSFGKNNEFDDLITIFRKYKN